MNTPIDKDMLDSATTGTRRAGQGDFVNYLMGKRLTQRQAIKAKCYDCDGMGDTGECDCISCALYPYSPYKIAPKEVTDE